jgi:hypothetical protein
VTDDERHDTLPCGPPDEELDSPTFTPDALSEFEAREWERVHRWGASPDGFGAFAADFTPEVKKYFQDLSAGDPEEGGLDG